MLQSSWLKDFECLGDKCEDTCCKGWGMQVDDATMARYKAQAPELLESVTSGEAEHIMKRNPETDYCIQFDKGWCKIHASKGDEFLGDACYLFPRITRQLGRITVQTATLSCPEIARLALLSETDADDWHNGDDNVRLPSNLRNYLPDNLEPDKALQIHQLFLQAAMADDAPADKIIARLHSVAQSMAAIDIATWPMATEFYLKNADSRLAEAQKKPEDIFNIYHSLSGLASAAKVSSRPSLEEIIKTMQVALDVKADESTGSIIFGENSIRNLEHMREGWKFIEHDWQNFFKRYIRTELGMALFPFAGFGETMADRITIIGVRLATLKLALQSHLFVKQTLTQADAIHITQSLARFLDHLAEPDLSMQICIETGWTKTERLWGLLE